MTKRKFVPFLKAVAAASVAAVLALTGCAAPSPSADTSMVFKLGTTEQATELNPFKPGNGLDLLVWREIFPQLVTYDADLQPAPALAESWEWSPDYLTLTMTLASGATWSDGEDLTARDAAFTINTVVGFADSVTATPAAALAGVTSAEAVDDTTLVINYSAPQADALGNMAYQFFIVPEHIWAPYTKGDGTDLLTFTNRDDTVTAGPFDLVKWAPDFVLTARNDDYWGDGPKIEGFGVEYFANDESLTSAVVAGRIDGVRIPSSGVIRAGTVAGMQLDQAEGLGYYTLEVNANQDKPENRELLDPAVREALDLGIDRERILEEAFLGYGSPGIGPITPGSQFFDSALTEQPFDLAAAEELLDDAGYERGPDGIRIADGHRMSYEFNFPSTMRGPGDRVFAILKQDWEKLGIEVTAKYIDAAANAIDIYGNDNAYDTFDLGFWDWIALPPEPSFILGVQTCAAWGGYNDTGYCNAEYDRLFALQATQIDPVERQATLDQMQTMLRDARGLIVFTTAPATALYQPGWAGITVTGLQSFELPITWLNIHRAD